MPLNIRLLKQGLEQGAENMMNILFFVTLKSKGRLEVPSNPGL